MGRRTWEEIQEPWEEREDAWLFIHIKWKHLRRKKK
jgi:hypothetical protein